MKTTSTSKTPYEIRLDLLQLAFDILVQKASAEAQKKAYDMGQTTYMVTSAPNTDDVISEAEKLNKFVSQASISGNNRV